MTKNIISKIKTFPVIIGNLIENYKFREALKEMMNISRIGNKYLADEEPWKLFASKSYESLNNYVYIYSNNLLNFCFE